MKWTWRVGALRAGAENVDWTDSGAGDSWTAARAEAIAALRALVQREGRQEYRIQVADVDGIVHPGLAADRSTRREDGLIDVDRARHTTTTRSTGSAPAVATPTLTPRGLRH